VRLQPVIVPYRYDERDEGLGRGPGALVQSGLVGKLRTAGHDVADPVESVLTDEERTPGPVAVNIGKLGAKTAALVADARRSGAAALVLAGDDTAAIGAVAGLQQAAGAGAAIGVVWLDAHGDFNTPETSYSGILAGMPVAILAGLAGPLWRGAAHLDAPIPTDRILIAGARDLDEKEANLIRSTDVRLLTTDDIRSGDSLANAIRRLAASCELIYLHVDLDILDPSLVPSASTPSAAGLTVTEAAGAMGTVFATGLVAAAGIAGLNPGAGARGERSTKNTLALIEQALAPWSTSPAASA
jgi:arginase